MCICIVVPHCPVGGAEHAVGIESTLPSRPPLTKTVCISSPAQQVPGDIARRCAHIDTPACTSILIIITAHEMT